MMKKTIFILSTVFYSLTVKADLPGPAYQYDRYSENGKYFFKSIPFYNYDLTNFGKTLVYSARTKKELYKIDNYLPSEAFISNTGKTLITTSYWMSGHTDIEDQTLIKIYINDSDTVQYYVDDLIKNKSKLQQTVSHTLWYKKMFAINDTLNIITLENKVVRIDMSKGLIIDLIPKDKCKPCSNLDKLKKPKTIFYRDIKYPEGYIFPDLKSGEPFRKSLINGLDKEEVKEYSDCTYYIMVYSAIDKSGNCEIFMLRANVDEKENEEWSKQVSDWITKQKYKTDLNPENCDKWVFQEYFYLK